MKSSRNGRANRIFFIKFDFGLMIIVDNVYGKFNGKKLYKATTFSLCSFHVTRGVVFDTNDVSSSNS